MKKALVFLFMISNIVCFSASGKGDKVQAPNCYSETVYDSGTNTSIVCGGTCDKNSVEDGTPVFGDFPSVKLCTRDIYEFTWTETNTLCATFKEEFKTGIYATRIDPVPNVAGKCWKWECKAGYSLGEGGRCQSMQEYCDSIGQVIRDGQCAPTWCNDYPGFNTNIHVEVRPPNSQCAQYRCKAGTWFATLTDKSTCRACDPVQGTRGGCYGNEGYGTNDGVYVQCNRNQYVNKVADGKWECANVATITKDRIESCWKCPVKQDMVNCLQRNIPCQ